MAFTFSDIVELAKAGYKPSDVKELLELSKVTTMPETNETEKVPEVIKTETENKETDSNKSSVFESIAD